MIVSRKQKVVRYIPLADFQPQSHRQRASPRRWQLFGHDAAITTLGFTPKGNYLVSCSEDGELRVWDAATTDDGVTEILRASLHETRRLIPSMVFSDGAELLLTSVAWKEGEGQLLVWRGRTKE